MAEKPQLYQAGTALSCFIGAAGTGKTQQLIDQIAQLQESGAADGQIVILSATPTAAASLERRLKQAGIAGDLRVCTPRELALNVLDTPEAQAITGRDARMLLPFELHVLMEDVKTTGIRQKRLREMLKFFYRGWTELADDDPDWLITNEEKLVVDTLKGSLALMRGLIEPEISNLAVHVLRENPDVLERYQRDYVFADDYQSYNLASQVMVGMLTRKALTIAGDPFMQHEVFDSYPHTQSLADLAEAPGVRMTLTTDCYHSSQVQAATVSLLKDSCFASAVPTVSLTPFDTDENLPQNQYLTPEDELQAEARWVIQLLAEGVPAGDIAIAVPNRGWLSATTNALEQEGIACESIPHPLQARLNDPGRCIAELVFCALALTADPTNPLALRTWCAKGEAIGGSSVFAALARQHQTSGDSLATLLQQTARHEILVDETDIYDLDGVLHSYTQAQQIHQLAKGLRGRALLDQLTELVSEGSVTQAPDILLRLCAPVHDDASASELYTNAVTRATLPAFELDKPAVRIGLYEQCFGLNPRILLLSGFVNGLFPNHKYFEDDTYSLVERERMHDNDARALYVAVSRPDDMLAIGYFTRASIEDASALHVKIERIHLQDGRRVCATSKSLFTDELVAQEAEQPSAQA